MSWSKDGKCGFQCEKDHFKTKSDWAPFVSQKIGLRKTHTCLIVMCTNKAEPQFSAFALMAFQSTVVQFVTPLWTTAHKLPRLPHTKCTRWQTLFAHWSDVHQQQSAQKSRWHNAMESAFVKASKNIPHAEAFKDQLLFVDHDRHILETHPRSLWLTKKEKKKRESRSDCGFTLWWCEFGSPNHGKSEMHLWRACLKVIFLKDSTLQQNPSGSFWPRTQWTTQEVSDAITAKWLQINSHAPHMSGHKFSKQNPAKKIRKNPYEMKWKLQFHRWFAVELWPFVKDCSLCCWLGFRFRRRRWRHRQRWRPYDALMMSLLCSVGYFWNPC